MAKTLDLSRTVHDLVADYPELRDVMASIGFPDIAKPMALNTVGRVMTIPKGCAIKELDLDQVRSRLEAAGFIVVDGETGEAGATEKAGVTEGQPDAADSEPGTAAEKTDASASDPTDRASLLKSYVGRLTAGEDLESVQADFAAHFQDVDATEIMDAEQQLIAEGAPLPEVTRLCDVHSALFHGATREEIDGAATSSMIDKAAAAVEAAFAQQDGAFAQHDGAFAQHDGAFAQDSVAQPAEAASEVARNHAAADAHTTDAARLVATPGHPLNVLTSENDAIASHIAAARTALDAGDHETAVAEIHELRQIGNHYRKKGDLLYPLLANRYGVTGPSNVMWTVDGEIRDELRDLAARPDARDWNDRARAVLKRADEMIYKEANILFPICAANLSEEEWENLAFDIAEYAPCLIEPVPVWSKAAPMPAAPAKADGAAATEPAPAEIVLPSGTFTLPELRALLNTIPGEITFVGADDLNRYFNESEGPKDFARPLTALGRPVYSCHPPKVESMVRWLFEEFRTGKQDSFDMWHKRGDRDLWVRYLAVRDREGTYLGTLEFVQDLTAARKHFEGEAEKPYNPMAGIEDREEQEW